MIRFTVVALLMVPAAFAATQTQYRITDLGVALPDGSSGIAVNARGEVAVVDPVRAYRWSGGSLTDLGTLGGPSSFATSLNSRGQVVGWSGRSDGQVRAFQWENGSMTDLGTLGGSSQATGINASGSVTGYSDTGNGTYHAFLHQNGSMLDLGTLGGARSYGVAINNLGQVVGGSDDAGGNYLPFLWSNGTMVPLGSNIVNVRDINDAGLVVGETFLSGEQHAGLFDGKTTLDLGTLGGSYSSATAINGAGQVVGLSTDASGDYGVFLWSEGRMTDVGSRLTPDSQGWTLSIASDINDSGQIVGYGTINGKAHAYLATPVPEPASLAALAVSLGVLLRRRRVSVERLIPVVGRLIGVTARTLAFSCLRRGESSGVFVSRAWASVFPLL